MHNSSPENEDVTSTLDFSQLLAIPSTSAIETIDLPAAWAGPAFEADDLNTHGLGAGVIGEWDLSEQPSVDPFDSLEEPDYTRFENFIPTFSYPEKSCEYCRARRLNCYITQGQAACTPCSTLFRDCSLTSTHTLEPRRQSSAFQLDTLHVVDEDVVKDQGTLTGVRPLRSQVRSSSRPLTPEDDDVPGSSKRNGIRFPRHAVKILREWVNLHADNPYPTDREKAELEEKTELKPSQIANWFANHRRRRRVMEKARPKVCASPSLRPSTPAIAIPASRAEKPWDELNPFERWRHSPPEHEPAAISDIANAMANTEPLDDSSNSPSTLGPPKKHSSAGSGLSNVKAASTTSLDTGKSSSLSTTSAAFSHHSSQSRGSFGSFSSGLGGKRDRRRRRGPLPTAMRKTVSDHKRIYQCTFCTDAFKSKYDWTRHEKSLHLSLEKWVCAPLGPIVTDGATGTKRCAYCNESEPSLEHIETHGHRQCDDKGVDARTFYRKDHLRQHLRLMHNCELAPSMQSWKSSLERINCRCGFCAQEFTVWQERVDHLAVHYRGGARIAEWKGCRGLDPAIAAQVTNAMPPYLIGDEAKSLNPYSASNRGSWRHVNDEVILAGENDDLARQAQSEASPDEMNRTNCWEVLTIRLGRYANQMNKDGLVLTDEMLQAQARRLMYGSDDSWNQTAADNPQWLDLFKKALGLNFIPNTLGGQGQHVPEDLETYQDLGLRVPFQVQLQLLNHIQAQEGSRDSEVTGQYLMSEQFASNRQSSSAGKSNDHSQLAREGVLRGSGEMCTHAECQSNIVNMDNADGSATAEQLHWCMYEVSVDDVHKLATLDSPASDTYNSASLMEVFGMDPSAAPQENFVQSLIDMEDRPNRTGTSQAPVPPATSHPSARLLHYRPTTSRPTGPAVAKRHLYELTPNQARRFATIRGASAHSGVLPDAVPTIAASSSGGPQRQTSTPSAASASTITLQPFPTLHTSVSTSEPTIHIDRDNMTWAHPSTAEEQQAMLRDLDQLIADTTVAHPQQEELAGVAQNFDAAAAAANVPAETSVEDLRLDGMDMNFDGVFDFTWDDPSLS